MKRLAIVGVLSLAACSSGTNLKQFEGTWHYTAGASFSYHCTSTPTMLFDLEDAGMVIGEDGGVLVATRFRDMQAPCVEIFDVKDNVATAMDAGPCDFDAGFLPTPIQVTLTTDTLTLSADQNSMGEHAEGSAVVIGIPCPAAVNGTLIKE